MNNCIPTLDDLHEMEKFLEARKLPKLAEKNYKIWTDLSQAKRLNQ